MSGWVPRRVGQYPPAMARRDPGNGDPGVSDFPASPHGPLRCAPPPGGSCSAPFSPDLPSIGESQPVLMRGIQLPRHFFGEGLPQRDGMVGGQTLEAAGHRGVGEGNARGRISVRPPRWPRCEWLAWDLGAACGTLEPVIGSAASNFPLRAAPRPRRLSTPRPSVPPGAEAPRPKLRTRSQLPRWRRCEGHCLMGMGDASARDSRRSRGRVGGTAFGRLITLWHAAVGVPCQGKLRCASWGPGGACGLEYHGFKGSSSSVVLGWDTGAPG